MGNKQRTVGALILSGAPGSGKTSVLAKLGTRLESEGCAFGAIETEQLAQGSPLLRNEEWIPQLAAVLCLQREIGRRLFLIVATLESEADLQGVVAAAAADKTLVVCLRADAETLAYRLDARESARWPGKKLLIEHARALTDRAPAIEGVDLVVDTDSLDCDETAAAILGALEAADIYIPSTSA
jgi:broad-specificity NMP kinase